MTFNSEYYYVLVMHSCSESGTFGITHDLNFQNKIDALLYCKYNNWRSKQLDSSNSNISNIYYIKYDITKDIYYKIDANIESRKLRDSLKKYVDAHAQLVRQLTNNKDPNGEITIAVDELKVLKVKLATVVYEMGNFMTLSDALSDSLSEFYDHDGIMFDLFYLTYDINTDYIYNVKIINHEQSIIYLNEINKIIENKEQNTISITNLIKYIQLIENIENIGNSDYCYDYYCEIIRLFFTKASLYQIKTLKIDVSILDCDGEPLVRSLIDNKSFSLYALLNNKVISIENLLSRSCNHVGALVANNHYEYELVIKYLSGECDKYGHSYDEYTANEKHQKLKKIIEDTEWEAFSSSFSIEIDEDDEESDRE